MLMLRAARLGWIGLLGAMPRPMLARLDAWARAHAQKRAQRRLQRLLSAQQR